MGNIEEEHITVKQIVSGGEQKVAGTTGRWNYFHAKTNVKLGGWYNAAKSYLDLDATGHCSGLMSAHNSELRLPTTAPAGGAGSYTCHEYELVTQAGGTTGGVPVTFQWFQVSGDGTATADWEDNGYAMVFKGLTEGTGNIFSAGEDVAAAATLRIMIGTTDYYILLGTGEST